MNVAELQKKYGLSPEAIRQAGISESELTAIAEDHDRRHEELTRCAEDISKRAMKLHGSVHSVRYRVKDTGHLLEKILRKKIDNREREITVATYKEEITDLCGVRILHLFKDQWENIHHELCNTWSVCGTPVAYYRHGDNANVQPVFESYKRLGVATEEHQFGYRSVHYIISTSPTKKSQPVEVQVRTVFEEGWSEIDHTVRYPNGGDGVLLDPFLRMFSVLAGYADYMGAYGKMLAEEVSQKKTSLDAIKDKLDKALTKLTISESEKKGLREQVDELTSASAGLSVSAADSLWNDTDFSRKLIRSFNDWNLSPSLSLMQKPCSTCGNLFFPTWSAGVDDRCTTCQMQGKK